MKSLSQAFKLNWILILVPVYFILIPEANTMTIHPIKNLDDSAIGKPDRKSNEYVVGANTEISEQDFEEIFTGYKITAVTQSSKRPIVYLIVFDKSYDFDAIDKLAHRDGRILYIEPNFLYYKQKPPSNKLP